MLPSSYGWAGVAVAIAAIVAMILWALRGVRSRATVAADAKAVAVGNKAVADANAAAAESRATDRGPTPGCIVREHQKPTGDL
jgi:hypothetical protein